MTEAHTQFKTYLHELNRKLATGDTTEHSHRAALQQLIEVLLPGANAINDPKRSAVGAPDFVVKKGQVIIGHIEAKDIGIALDKVEKSEQFKRYVPALSNFILTDYLEFRHYIDGKRHYQKSLGILTAEGKIKRYAGNIPVMTELLDRFLSMKAVAVGTPRELAVHMARMAHQIRNLIIETLRAESESGQLHSQLAAFRENLIPDLSVEQFADMYAQTIAYGLFAARCTMPAEKHFTRFDAAQNLPKTNPFLRKLFQHIAGYELDERIAWLVDELAQVLAQADMGAVLQDFGKHSGKEDPVVHFYETFLKEYDPKMREMRGVYYTPEPVVSYIVRSVDYLLKTCFNKSQGLADSSVYVLDPAVGTATFLYMVINEIHETIVGHGQKGVWNDYVAKKLLPRLFGFELLMAPYAVAHLKLGLQLQDTDYKFESDERLGIYLTNTLEQAAKHTEQALFAQWITKEANEAAAIKKEKPIMVVLGNPPYSGVSANRGEWINQLINDYRVVDGKPLEERKVWLQNDYVKFIRFGQWRIERTGQGILAFITDHSYLDSPTFRGMRQALINTFTDIYILDLHGDSRRRETAPDSSIDENVFDIQQGVAIAFFVKEPDNPDAAVVHHFDLWGLRDGKYQTLLTADIGSTHWSELHPKTPFYLFAPLDEDILAEYEQGWKVTDVFPVNTTGIQTSRDDVVLDFSMDMLRARISELRDLSHHNHAMIDKYGLREMSFWKVPEARKSLSNDKEWESRFVSCLYRPFDTRSLFYSSAMVHRTRYEVMRHLLERNRALCIGRAGQVTGSTEWDVLFCDSQVVDLNIFYRGGGQCFPLYLYPTEGAMQFEEGRRPNINPEFIEAFSDKVGLKFTEDGKGDLKKTFGPEDVFNYAYAVFHCPTYRSRYAEFLKIDFPRLPLTSDQALFKVLAEKGAELVALHLMEAPVLNTVLAAFPVSGNGKVEKVNYDEKLHRVNINKDQYFKGVAAEVWNFRIGGYQVAEKWLKDRKGRKLSHDDVTHYQRIIVALKETIRLMEEIDQVIPSWPIE